MSDEDFLSIDSMRLDREWQNQPERYHEYAAALADAQKELDDVKVEMDVVRAEIFMDVIKRPTKYGLAKTTEAAVNAMITTQPAIRDMMKRIGECKHNVALYRAAVDALEHRKRALEKLVELHLADYYSAPRARKESREFIEEEKKRAARRGRKRE